MSNLFPEIPQLGHELISLITSGQVSKMNDTELNQYYTSVCETLKLNPLTRPFEWLTFGGKKMLYATKDCAAQLRKIYGISIRVTSAGTENDTYDVWVLASTPNGREEANLGSVNVYVNSNGKKSLMQGETLANAKMKAITKATRRATLSICGLGFLDEHEVETIPGATQSASFSGGKKTIDAIDELKALLQDCSTLSDIEELDIISQNATVIEALMEDMENKAIEAIEAAGNYCDVDGLNRAANIIKISMPAKLRRQLSMVLIAHAERNGYALKTDAEGNKVRDDHGNVPFVSIEENIHHGSNENPPQLTEPIKEKTDLDRFIEGFDLLKTKEQARQYLSRFEAKVNDVHMVEKAKSEYLKRVDNLA